MMDWPFLIFWAGVVTIAVAGCYHWWRGYQKYQNLIEDNDPIRNGLRAITNLYLNDEIDVYEFISRVDTLSVRELQRPQSPCDLRNVDQILKSQIFGAAYQRLLDERAYAPAPPDRDRQLAELVLRYKHHNKGDSRCGS